ncbi:hypothetical protein LZ189_08905, partial [Rhodovulum sulfidophilum]|nr:hypothetical protein [Rhodovulum sulfidophilum]
LGRTLRCLASKKPFVQAAAAADFFDCATKPSAAKSEVISLSRLFRAVLFGSLWANLDAPIDFHMQLVGCGSVAQVEYRHWIFGGYSGAALGTRG